MSDVSLFITSEQTSSERRISPSWTIATLKSKLEPITGIPPASQKLKVYGTNNDSATAVDDSDDAKLIGQYSLVPYGRVHVEDTRPPASRDNFNDPSGVEKYVMPESEYEARKDSVLQWKKDHHLGRFDPTAPSKAGPSASDETKDEVAAKGIKVSSRCKVTPGDRLGTVKYVGVVTEIHASSRWVGIEFDEPVGKNDGSIQGHRYFTAKPSHGSFVKPALVEIGDFPAEDDFDEL